MWMMPPTLLFTQTNPQTEQQMTHVILPSAPGCLHNILQRSLYMFVLGLFTWKF